MGVERHITRHTFIVAVSLAALVVAVGAFLVSTLPLLASSFGLIDPAAASCGCAVTAASFPPTVVGLLALLTVLGVAFLGRLGYATCRSLLGTVRVRRWLDRQRVEPPFEFAQAASRAGLTDRVVLVPAFPEGLMTIGFFHPRVFVSRAFADSMEPDELEAALSHEAAHVRRRDPVRQFLTVILESIFGFLPSVRRLAHNLRAEIELSADAAASASFSNTDALSRAFLKALAFGGHAARPIAATALSVTDDRLEQLLNPRRSIFRHIPSAFVLGLALVISVSLFAVHGVAARTEMTMNEGQLCRPTPRCVTEPMSPAPHFSTEHGMCGGGVCLTVD